MGTMTQRKVRWPPPPLTGSRWAAMSFEERAEMVAGIEELAEAVVAGLEGAGLVVEEYERGRYRCVPA